MIDRLWCEVLFVYDSTENSQLFGGVLQASWWSLCRAVSTSIVFCCRIFGIALDKGILDMSIGPELILVSRQLAHRWLKPGFHYPSWRAVNSGAFFDTRQLGCQKMHPSSRAVNSGSGNRALVISPPVGCISFLQVYSYLPSHRTSPPFSWHQLILFGDQ